jgi:sucrose-phosphate synthase
VGLYVLHLHLHGLFRGHDLELGRDPDTGGQTTYVLQLVQALAARPEVALVEVVTRQIHDRRVAADYAQAEEPLGPRARAVRLPFGPRRYLRKELLWPHLDELADALVKRLRGQERLPDWIHAHYADAGYVGALLQRRLGIPLVFTGHSLGREKRRRLIHAGLDPSQIEAQYAMARRIDAEEMALAHSQLVVTSTRQERDQQYSRYRRFLPERTRVIPPGVNSLLFHPPRHGAAERGIEALMQPFLRQSVRPPLLAICRPDPRKNIAALVEVFGRSELLRSHHNLVLVLGSRDDPRQLEQQQRNLLQQLFELVDRHDLYGRVAYPKRHQRCQIPEIYRWASRLGGVFVNPALTEPFGLTLLEAAASGLPLVATDDGGPRDILATTASGQLVDVSDLDALQQALEESLRDRDRWRRWSHNGIEAVSRSFSWDAHINRYLLAALPALALGGSFGASGVLGMAERRRPLQSDSRFALAITTRQKHLRRQTPPVSDTTVS